MEVLSSVLSTQVLFPASAVAVVLICAILVFVFGFKSADQPQFEKLSAGDDRKQAGKKRKPKDKKSLSNGQTIEVDTSKSSEVRVSPTKKSPAKDKQVANKEQEKKQVKKETKQAEKTADKKSHAPVKGKDNAEAKTKKSIKGKQPEEKPLDFDDGNWETVLTKTDKKNRKNQEDTKKPDSPKKSQKKNKQIDSNILDNKKLDEVTKELKDKVNEQQKAAAAEVEKQLEVVLTPVEVVQEAEEKPAVESVVQKKNKKPAKKETATPKKEVTEVKKEVKKETKKEEKVVLQQVKAETEPPKTAPAAEQPVAFDELGDVWTEAKAPKKAKKKARKE